MADSKSIKSVPLKATKPAAVKSKPVAAKVAGPVADKVAKPDAAPVSSQPIAAVPAAVVPVAEPTMAAPATVPEILTQAIEPAVIQKEAKIMTDTVTNFAEDTKARVETAIGDFQARAKAAVEKGQTGLADVAEFSKGNVEAMVASAKVAAKGAQDIAAYTVEYGKGAVEKAVADTRRLYAVKSPTEFFQVQSEITKSAVDEAVAQVSKFTENYLKLVGEVVQPLQNRYALATEKAKTALAA